MEDLLSTSDFFANDSDLLPRWSTDFDFNPWETYGTTEIGDLTCGDVWSQQQTPFTCAVVSQQMILSQFGIDVSEAQLVYDATSNGWLTDGGTTMADVGKLLEKYGIGTHQGAGGGIQSLIEELGQGRKVIVGVDSGEIWGADFPFADWMEPGNGADHAIVVNGIDVTDPSNIQVYVNDPGEPDGAGKAYPIEQFMDAWNASGQFYVATNGAPPDLASDMMFGSNFDANSGWYVSQGFWEGMLASIASGLFTSNFVEGITGDEDLGKVAGFAAGIYRGFSTVIDHMSQDQVDSLFYNV